MIALQNLVLLLSMASNASAARRITNKDRRDLSVENWGRLFEAKATTTTTTPRPTPNPTPPRPKTEGIDKLPLPDCLSISTFPGKCSISQHPGACYAEDDDVWQCWGDTQEIETMTDKMCTETVGKQGACIFKDHFVKPASEDDLKVCTDVPGYNAAKCHPLPEMWGACYNKELDDWRCIRKDDPDINRYRDGDCKSMSTTNNNQKAYDDVCLVSSVEETVYTCPSVPTYTAGVAGFSCDNVEGVAFACFSLRENVTWQCRTNDDKTSVPSCGSIQLPLEDQSVKDETYDGVCVHASSPLHKQAKSADVLAIRKTTTTTTTTLATTKTTTAASTKAPPAGKTTDTTDESAPKTLTTVAPDEATTTTKSGTTKSQFHGLTMVVFLLMARAY